MNDASKPSGAEGRSPATETIERVLSSLREPLEMDVAFVSEFVGDRLVFRAVEGEGESFGWREGESIPLEASFCKRVIDGRLGNVVPDVRGDEATKGLGVTDESDIGAYCAVPLVLSDGRLFGTLCCASHTPDPWLRDRDMALMEKTATNLISRLERGGLLADDKA